MTSNKGDKRLMKAKLYVPWSEIRNISFNDRKQSLGSIGMATITKLENNFKVRQFPDGAKQGWSKTQSLIESDDWEQTIEGLEMLVSLARQHQQVTKHE